MEKIPDLAALCHDERVWGTPSSIAGAFTRWTKIGLSGKGQAQFRAHGFAR
jgi:hypothetical protein